MVKKNKKSKKTSNGEAIKEAAYNFDVNISLRPGIIKKGGKSKTKKRKKNYRKHNTRRRRKNISPILKRIRSRSRRRNY